MIFFHVSLDKHFVYSCCNTIALVVAVVQKRQQTGLARIIQDISWMVVSCVFACKRMSSGHCDGIRNQRGGSCCFASPWYLVFSCVNDSCVNDSSPWGQMECQLISEAGNYQPGRGLEWVHFNRKQVQTEKNLFYWCNQLSFVADQLLDFDWL